MSTPIGQSNFFANPYARMQQTANLTDLGATNTSADDSLPIHTEDSFVPSAALQDQKWDTHGSGAVYQVASADNYKYLRDEKGKYMIGADGKFMPNLDAWKKWGLSG